jgi:hypothetical protein
MKKITKKEKSLVAEAVTFLLSTRRKEVEKVLQMAKGLTAAQRRNLGPIAMHLLALLELEIKVRSVRKKR